tara:strand:- start:221 stop:418 length:198 start_codon:yes stop_codon:yes gene_type:complete
MNAATTRNWEKKEAIIARLERTLANKEYSLNLAKPYENDATNPYYYTSALYDYKMAKNDLEDAKK